MLVAVAVPAVLVAALISLATSRVLVSQLERLGERPGLSEPLPAIVAALAAAPEVTAAATAMAGHLQRLGGGSSSGRKSSAWPLSPAAARWLPSRSACTARSWRSPGLS